jgi:membrane protein YqaA with SNARE-associated domain
MKRVQKILTSVPPGLTLIPAMSHHEADKPLEQENDIATVDKTDEEQPAEPKVGVKRKGQLKYLLLLAAALLAVILVTVLVQKPTNFDEYLKSSGYVGVFLMALIGSASPIWPLPGSWAVFIAAGLGLNPIILGLLGGLGEAIGELTGYTAGFGGQVALQRFKRYKQIEGWMIRWGGPTIFVVSAIPNVFIKAATIAAGGLRYPIWKFFLFCWAGKTVKSLAFAFAGYGLFDGIRHLIDRIF